VGLEILEILELVVLLETQERLVLRDHQAQLVQDQVEDSELREKQAALGHLVLQGNQGHLEGPVFEDLLANQVYQGATVLQVHQDLPAVLARLEQLVHRGVLVLLVLLVLLEMLVQMVFPVLLARQVSRVPQGLQALVARVHLS